jgi:thiol-disulfide isomerase/thioredoxin
LSDNTTFKDDIYMKLCLRRLALGLSLFLVALSAAAGKATIQQFRSSMLVPDDATVQFEDVTGHSISYEAFLRALHGGSFSKELDTEAKTAVFRINDASAIKKANAARTPSLNVHLGELLPAEPLVTLSGTRVKLAQADGRYTLLSFYFDECVPCIAEIPALNAFAREHPDVHVLAVTFDSVSRARTFKSVRHLPWPIVADAQALIDTLGVQTYPTLVVVRPDGRLAETFSGSKLPGAAGDETAEAALAAWVHQAEAVE